MKRRKFLSNAVAASNTLAFMSIPLSDLLTNEKPLKLSLAQWSIHKQLFDGSVKAQEFPQIAASYGIKAIEYVNQFYVDVVNKASYWSDLKRRNDDLGIRSLLIMVDDEGDLGVANELERKQSVTNHFKWVDAANTLGCHSIRVNAFGDSDRTVFKNAIKDSMSRLAEYAATASINVVIENHGLFSSDAEFITNIVQEVDKPNFGTFPDFGNWCLSAKWGSTQSDECTDVYNIYKGVEEMLPYAKAVSAKSYNFDSVGNDTKIDYYKILKLVKESSYDGHIGIEYEGEKLNEHQGILATKALIEKVWRSI